MEVYHGSYTEIVEIDLSKGRENRDFGRGFYVTKFREQAEFWAKKIGGNHKCEGVITEFNFVENSFDYLEYKTLRFDSYSEEWLDFVVLNRNVENPRPAHDYDIVEGPIADDDVSERILDYLEGSVSKSDFLEELIFHEPTHQICFCTLKSLQAIKKIKKDEMAYKLKEITKPIILSLVANDGFDKAEATDKLYASNTFSKLEDITTKLYEKDWTEIYELLKQELKTK
jgi:hypothetical protein